MSSSTKKIGILIIVLILISFGLLYGLYTSIHTKANAIASLKLENEKKNAEAEEDRSMRIFLEDSSDDIQRLTSRIVAKEGTVGFIEMIEDVARSQNLTIAINNVMVSEPEQNKERFDVLHLTLETQGEWAPTYTFVSLIESLPYNTSIDTVALTSNVSSPIASPDKKDQKLQPKALWDGTISFTVLKYK